MAESAAADGAGDPGAAAATTAAPLHLKILAIGDSLTEGVHDGGMAVHPYALRLRASLLQQLPPGSSVFVDERGQSGEFVVPEMQARLHQTLDEAPANHPYDWVLIMGGTNDILSGAAAADLLPVLASMHAAAAADGTRVGAFALPPLNLPMPPAMQEQHAALNAGLRAMWAGAALAGGAPKGSDTGAAGDEPVATVAPAGSVLVSLDELLPSLGQNPAAEARLWDDGLHLTAAGYDLVGAAAAGALLRAMGLGHPVGKGVMLAPGK